MPPCSSLITVAKSTRDDIVKSCTCHRQDAESVREYNLANHIILILGAPSATVLSHGVGLRNFLLPLRASSIRSDDIRAVVFCVSRRFIEPEWNTVANFPKVFVFEVCQCMPHSRFCRRNHSSFLNSQEAQLSQRYRATIYTSCVRKKVNHCMHFHNSGTHTMSDCSKIL